MAKRHVVEYYLIMQNQYLEMLDNMKEFEELLKENRITEDEYNAQVAEIENLKANYERISYIMMLLNKPNRKSKEEVEITKSWYQALSGASKEALIDENKDCLADFKALLKKASERKEGE